MLSNVVRKISIAVLCGLTCAGCDNTKTTKDKSPGPTTTPSKTVETGPGTLVIPANERQEPTKPRHVGGPVWVFPAQNFPELLAKFTEENSGKFRVVDFEAIESPVWSRESFRWGNTGGLGIGGANEQTYWVVLVEPYNK